MRQSFYGMLLAIPAAAALAGDPLDPGADSAEFRDAAESFQQLYTAGGENCGGIVEAMAEDVELVENGETWGHAQLEKFCPHLPKKNVVDTWADRSLIGPGLGYEFVTLTYENDPAVRRRETTVRVWRKKAEGWKIVRMSSVLSVVAPESGPESAGE